MALEPFGLDETKKENTSTHDFVRFVWFNAAIVEDEMTILSRLGVTKGPRTTVTNIKTGGFYTYDHSEYDINVDGQKVTVVYKTGKKKGQTETMSLASAALGGYLSGTFF